MVEERRVIKLWWPGQVCPDVAEMMEVQVQDKYSGVTTDHCRREGDGQILR